jgi:hypothetical protein
MKRKAIYSLAIGIAIAAVVILIIPRVTSPSSPSSIKEEQPIDSPDNNDFGGINISIENITAERNRENETNFQVQFGAFNPNKSTVILEAITYNVFANNTRIVSGDIGEKLEGFVASQESVFPIIANGTITLKDSHNLPREELAAKNLEEILNGQPQYTVNGTYSYKQTSSIQAIGADRDFELTFR